MSAMPGRRRDAEGGDRSASKSGYWALLRAVPTVVSRAGFRGLTYRALAKEAGVTYGLITYYFGSRESVIVEAGRLASEEAIAKSDLVPESAEISDFATGLSKLIAEEPDAQAFQYELTCEARRSPALLPPVRRMYELYVDAISEALDGFEIDHDPALARVIFATLDGLALQQLVFDDERKTDESIEALQEILRALRGCAGDA